MYVARDKDGALFLFMNMPKRNERYECWQSINSTRDYVELLPTLFPEVSWKDDNPTEVKLVIQRNKRMCIEDKTKACNLCHECDVYVLNPNY
jgi:hypothetical protein